MLGYFSPLLPFLLFRWRPSTSYFPIIESQSCLAMLLLLSKFQFIQKHTESAFPHQSEPSAASMG
jgi:hypothetical protein